MPLIFLEKLKLSGKFEIPEVNYYILDLGDKIKYIVF
jgi:hypothetical protein